ncbi:RNA ligase [Catellatospora tritici]|uniref:RNA ligase n=1 Tax=Catellatospora tritici TaxID=2851566 RepID=UPI001C2DBFCA|nr:RNA ligase [Catellatospora tritici]MBV1848866.1 2'-5' RNA ligase [Catellatospora tritici]
MSPLATTTLDALFPAPALERALTEGLVRRQRHPHLPLTIFNYTEKCTYANLWDTVTLSCRGLITDDTGVVVARPLAKFFNHGQPGAAEIGLDEPVLVTDKADGSLGVIYPTPDGPAVATRGSFNSDQARHATELLRKRYPHWSPPTGRTVLVEIIYPANRIVVDYGGLNDLMLLGAVDITTGRSYGPEGVPDWPGPVVEVFGYATFAEALAAPARPGREGLVVHAVGPDTRVKIKYADYLHLHRIIYGLHARGIWEALGAGATVAQIAEPLPDEFHGWITSVADRLRTEMRTRSARIEQTYEQIRAGLPEGWTRKDFALVAGRHELRGYLFARLDGKDYRPALWQEVRPEANETPHGRTFDDE